MSQFFAAVQPEAVGIPSDSIINFMNRLEQYNICMHSFILVRYGKVAAETYYYPYRADTLHRMFSVTKSFVSLAIGLLTAEGKISLDDRIIDHFPEKLPPGGVHPYIAKTTIQDMLMMASAHARTSWSNLSERDWVKTFFVVKPSHLPGTVFSYDTSSSHTLTALVEKLTGLSLLDYLRSKFLNEIGFSKEAYITTDPLGISQGGSGLMAVPMDLAKVAWIVMQQGEYRGKQYLPREYLAEAVKKQIDTSVKGNTIDEQQGYGYQFWRVRNNGYAMFGMGGQLAVCFPDKDLLFVTTADTQENACGVPIIMDSFFKNIYQNLSDQPLPKDPLKWSELKELLANSEIKPLKGMQNSNMADIVNGKEFLFSDNPMGLKSLKLELDKEHGKFSYINQTGSHKLLFGFNKLVVSRFPYYDFKCAASATWITDNTLVIQIRVVDEEQGTLTIQLAFKDDTVTVFMKKANGLGFNEFKEFSGFATSN